MIRSWTKDAAIGERHIILPAWLRKINRLVFVFGSTMVTLKLIAVAVALFIGSIVDGRSVNGKEHHIYGFLAVTGFKRQALCKNF